MRSPPLKLMMVLHYHCHPSCVKPVFSETSPAYRRFLSELERDGILRRLPCGEITTTDKGVAYIGRLCDLGYPTAQWGYRS